MLSWLQLALVRCMVVNHSISKWLHQIVVPSLMWLVASLFGKGTWCLCLVTTSTCLLIVMTSWCSFDMLQVTWALVRALWLIDSARSPSPTLLVENSPSVAAAWSIDLLMYKMKRQMVCALYEYTCTANHGKFIYWACVWRILTKGDTLLSVYISVAPPIACLYKCRDWNGSP